MNENELSNVIIGLCLKIHKKFGPGIFESVYEDALSYLLVLEGLRHTRQQNISFKDEFIKLQTSFRADIIVEDKVLIELKSIEAVAPLHKKQVLTYLRLSNLKLGLLINFNVMYLKDGIFRVVNNL